MAGKSKKAIRRRKGETVHPLAGTSTAFQDWVRDQGGKESAAALIGVKAGALHRWLARQGWPTTANVLRILDAADGELTFEDIIASTAKLPKNAVRRGRPPKPH